MKWDQSVDPDGRVTGYNIYKRGKDKTEKTGHSVTPEYSATGLSAGEDYVFEIRSVDDRGEESERAAVARTGVPVNFGVEVSGSYLVPGGNGPRTVSGR